MPIPVTCPGCLKRFSVADKFAGKQGPCPSCKKTITIPKLEEQVVIHARSFRSRARRSRRTPRTQNVQKVGHEVSAVGVHGCHRLRAGRAPHCARNSQFGPAGVLAQVLGAIMLGPPLAWAGYTFLRDPELEAHHGGQTIDHSLNCLRPRLRSSLGVFVFLGARFFGDDALKKGLEIWQMIVLILPIFCTGTLAAYASFDLDPGSAFFHCASTSPSP